jgi:23S rRNA pseudouridine2605 synthase
MRRPFQSRAARSAPGPTAGLARILSKVGYCSRSEATRLIRAGRVTVNGTVVRDPERRSCWPRERIEVDGQSVQSETRVYLALNKPRGLVTSASDEQGRATVFECLAGQELPFVAPVGRLDKASEGLLLFTNDTAWAAHITDPASHLDKTYHVQVDCVADQSLMRRLRDGLTDGGEFLSVKSARVLRQGGKRSWLELGLDEGKNRQIRRLLAALGVEVLRLIRVAIGPLELGSLAQGAFRHLRPEEVEALRRAQVRVS